MTEQKHFTDQEIATCAEAIIDGTFGKLDEYYSQHLANCDSCANQVTMVSSILEEESILLDENNTLPQSKPQKPISIYKTIAWAAAAILLVLIGFRFFPGQQGNNTNNDIAQSKTVDTLKVVQHSVNPTIKDTIVPANKIDEKTPKPNNNPQKHIITKPEKADLLAYSPNNNLEKLAERYNGAAMRGTEIKVTTPNTFETTANKILLEWENSDNVLVIIELFNNKGEKIIESETTDNNYQPKEKIKPGLYYWKLINEDFDLVFCGKIILK